MSLDSIKSVAHFHNRIYKPVSLQHDTTVHLPQTLMSVVLNRYFCLFIFSVFKVPTKAPKNQPIFFLNSARSLKVIDENCQASGSY